MQHVFHDPDDSTMVWKIPAVWDELLPHPPTLAAFQPIDPKKAAWWNRVRPLLQSPWLHGPAERGLRRYLRHRRIRAFTVMLQVVRRVQTLIQKEVLLPCEVAPQRHFVLETPAGVHRYAGPALKQRRADCFMARQCHLEFDWQAPIRIQHALWRIGVGLCDADTVLGPHNWAVLDGRLLLGDTGSLVTSRHEAMAVMAEGVRRGVEERLLSHFAPAGYAPAAAAYARTIWTGINPGTLVDLWNLHPGRDAPIQEQGYTEAGDSRTKCSGHSSLFPPPV